MSDEPTTPVDAGTETATVEADAPPTQSVSDKASRIIAIESALARASAEEKPEGTEESKDDEQAKPEAPNEPEKPADPPKRALSDDLRRKLDEAERDHREAAKLTRQAREKLALAEQRERQATEIGAKWEAQAKAIERLRAGDVMALADLGVPFETLQAAALSDPPSPKVQALEAELQKLRAELNERAEREAAERAQAEQGRKLAEYKSHLSSAFESDEVCAAFPDEALEIALDAQRRYVQRTGVLVDTAELVQYTAEKLMERAKRYAPIASKVTPTPVASSAKTNRAKPGVAPGGATSQRSPEPPAKPTNRRERAEAIARALESSGR